MKYRSRTEIASQILDAANSGATKTKIMYKSFLSYAQLKQYLAALVENGLLEYDTKTESYKTTEKGLKFNRLYNQIDEYVSPERKTKELPRT